MEVDRACQDVEDDELVDNKTLSLMTGAIRTRLMFDSVQRPGAVIGLRMSEYRRGREVEGVWVITVRASRDGPARLTLTKHTKEYVDRYVQTLRLVCDPFDKVDNLLVLPGGKADFRSKPTNGKSVKDVLNFYTYRHTTEKEDGHHVCRARDSSGRQAGVQPDES